MSSKRVTPLIVILVAAALVLLAVWLVGRVLNGDSSLLRDVSAVSYTHLDVYKRQARQGVADEGGVAVAVGVGGNDGIAHADVAQQAAVAVQHAADQPHGQQHQRGGDGDDDEGSGAFR